MSKTYDETMKTCSPSRRSHIDWDASTTKWQQEDIRDGSNKMKRWEHEGTWNVFYRNRTNLKKNLNEISEDSPSEWKYNESMNFDDFDCVKN